MRSLLDRFSNKLIAAKTASIQISNKFLILWPITMDKKMQNMHITRVRIKVGKVYRDYCHQKVTPPPDSSAFLSLWESLVDQGYDILEISK
jgi:hypothetical protein